MHMNPSVANSWPPLLLLLLLLQLLLQLLLHRIQRQRHYNAIFVRKCARVSRISRLI